MIRAIQAMSAAASRSGTACASSGDSSMRPRRRRAKMRALSSPEARRSATRSPRWIARFGEMTMMSPSR